MSSFLSIIKNIFLSFLVLAALGFAPLAINLNAFYSASLNESFWLKSFDETKTYESLSLGANRIFASALEETGNSISLPASWFKSQAENVLPDLMEFLRGEKDSLSAGISLKELKLQYINSALLNAKSGSLIQIPDCKAFEEFSFSSDANLPNCWPSTEEQKLKAMDLFLAMNGAESVPDIITLQEILGKTSEEEKNQNIFANARNLVNFFSLLFTASALIFFFILFLILLISRSLKFLGSALLLSGLSTAFSSILSFFLVSLLIPEKIFSSPELMFLNLIAKPLIERFVQQMQSTVLFYAGIMVLAGIALIIFGFLIQKPNVKVKGGGKAHPQNVWNE